MTLNISPANRRKNGLDRKCQVRHRWFHNEPMCEMKYERELQRRRDYLTQSELINVMLRDA